LHTLDSFDPLTAIVQWTEQGIAPDSMVARNSNTGLPPADVSSFTVLPLNRSRPLCPYPHYAKYIEGGQGDIDQASSFTCVAPPAGATSAKGTGTVRR
jgi:hypothetical protein